MAGKRIKETRITESDPGYRKEIREKTVARDTGERAPDGKETKTKKVRVERTDEHYSSEDDLL